MAKPTKGNKTKRPPSDENRLKKAHVNMLKRNKAIVLASVIKVPDEGFSVTKVSNKLIRIKGVGAQALVMANSKNYDEVVRCIKERNWQRISVIVERRDTSPIDYKVEVVTKY